jgi:hypothetical protein
MKIYHFSLKNPKPKILKINPLNRIACSIYPKPEVYNRKKVVCFLEKKGFGVHSPPTSKNPKIGTDSRCNLPSVAFSADP